MIETGAGTLACDWQPILDRMRQVGHVFSYERAGIGWSDGGPWRPDPTRTVEDLHRLLGVLGAEGTRGPWILVGHSLGGLFARQFAARYPTEVAALVLVDPSHEEQLRRAGATFGRKALALQVTMAAVYLGYPRFVARMVLGLGGIRLARKLVGGETDDEVRRNASLYLRSGFRRSYFAEMAAVPALARSLLSEPPRPGALPVAVVTAAPPQDAANLMARFRDDWLKMHESIASADRSIHLVADKGGHFVYKDDPDVVVQALEWAVTACGGVAPDTGNG